MTTPSSLGHITGWTVIGSYSVGIWCRLGRPHGTERAAIAEAQREQAADGGLVRVAVVTPRGDVLILRGSAVRIGMQERGSAA